MGTRQLDQESSDQGRPLTVRAFFGLPVPNAQRAQLDRYLAECAARAPQFRWTPADNLHLTIRFLGNVEPKVAEQIVDHLTDLNLPAFELKLGHVGAFKRSRLARVVWLGLDAGASDSAQLAGQVESACQRAGLEAESRRYQPHLTLARARARDGAALPELLPAPRLESWRADELILYRSQLGRAGAVYDPLRRISLG